MDFQQFKDIPLKQPEPYYLYQRFQFYPGETIKHFNHTVALGYAYVMKGIVCKIPEVNQYGNNLFCKVKIDIRSTERNRVRNNQSYDISLISSPVHCKKVIYEGEPVDFKAYGVSFSAEPFKNPIINNEMFAYRSNVFCVLTLDRSLSFLTYLDFLIRGYHVPETKLELWS